MRLKRSEAAVLHRAKKLNLNIKSRDEPTNVRRESLVENRWSEGWKRILKIFGFAMTASGVLANLATDEKWTIPMRRNVPLQFDADTADIVIAVTYWSPMLPRFLREIAARFTIHKQPDGQKIWIRRPVD